MCSAQLHRKRGLKPRSKGAQTKMIIDLITYSAASTSGPDSKSIIASPCNQLNKFTIKAIRAQTLNTEAKGHLKGSGKILMYWVSTCFALIKHNCNLAQGSHTHTHTHTHTHVIPIRTYCIIICKRHYTRSNQISHSGNIGHKYWLHFILIVPLTHSVD